MQVTTEDGTRENATERDVAAALSELQRGKCEFVAVARDAGGDALQTLQVPVELVRDGRIFRAASLPGVAALFQAFGAGAPGWDQGIEWVDVTDEIRRTKREPWVTLGVILRACAIAGFIGWLLIRRAGG
jgi:hypothetical protein